MFGLTPELLVSQVVKVWSAGLVAMWDAVATQPKLQVMLVGLIVLGLVRAAIGGALHAPARARHR